MDTNGIHQSEDADMTDCEGEKVVTMMDVLQEQQDFEEDANAVLGASDEKDCTYSRGYIKRQALYACMTCCDEAKTDPTKQAGVCLACSLNCHENHELIELYTKRNFRCDCGNPKFNSHPCQFTSEKPDFNEGNKYNQNFSGLYCTCKRPYPDPDNPVEDEMIQCIICEDWLHSSHLEASVPAHDQYSEMICKICMENNEFLHDYTEIAINITENDDVDVTCESTVLDSSLVNGDSTKNEEINGKTEKENATIEESVRESNDASMESELTEKNNLVTVENVTEDNKQEEKAEDKEKKSDEITSTGEANKNEPEISTAEPENQNQEAAEKINTESQETEQNTENSKPVDESTISTDQKSAENEIKDDSDSAKNESIQESKTDDQPVEEKKTETAEEEDNKEIEAIDKLLGEDTDNIEKSEIDVKPQDEKMEDSSTEIKQDEPVSTEDKSEDSKTEEKEQNSENKMDEITPATENSDKETSNIDNGSADKQEDVEINEKESQNTLANDDKNNTESPKIKRKLSTEETSEDATSKKPKLNEGSCVRPKGQKRIFKGATFWPSNFRQKLCTCNECTTMYKDLSVLYLIDPEDTVSAYETLGKEKINGAPTQYEKGLQALSSLDRVQQINALTEYNIMKDKLLDFLKSFKDRKEVVKEEDIKAFFAGMKAKREPDGVYFCR